MTSRVFEHIARKIKHQISTGKLTSGEKLPSEREMARRHQASRVSVREAYRSLEELGLLTIRRGADGGAFIAQPGHDAVLRSLSLALRFGRASHQELMEARVIVEPAIARLAARRARPEDIARLKLVIERQETALPGNRYVRRHHLLFQRAVAESAHNLPLATLMNSLAERTLEIVSGSNASSDVTKDICQFQRALLEAIKQHDEDAAYQAMQRHINGAQGD